MNAHSPTATDTLRQAAAQYEGNLVFATSFGAEDQVLTHMISHLGLNIPLATLDTGRLFPETYELWARTEEIYGIRIIPYFPVAEEVENMILDKGVNLFRNSMEYRHECCNIRKLRPLERLLAGKKAWICGLRSTQSITRKGLHITENDEANGIIKINPLANWSEEDVWNYIRAYGVPYNPLHDAGFPSIGCACCTRSVKRTEDVRDGRWWWEKKEHRECGLHRKPKTYKMNSIYRLSQLKQLEAESIHIFRDAISQFENPVLLYSIGKDSSVLVHLAKKAFYPGRLPFKLLHIDSTFKFREMIEFRDRFVQENDLDLIVHSNQEGIAAGVNPFTYGSRKYTDIMKTQALIQALTAGKYDAVFGGARRDEEKSRAKERIFSFRDKFNQWDPKNQRPELWNIYNGRINPGESVRIFPLSNWTELDIWQYIRLEKIQVVDLYFSKPRPIVERDGSLIMADDNRLPLKPGETPQMRTVRFRTLGCYPLTGAIESTARTVEEIVAEMLETRLSERSSRIIDHDGDASMEQKKREGYF